MTKITASAPITSIQDKGPDGKKLVAFRYGSKGGFDSVILILPDEIPAMDFFQDIVEPLHDQARAAGVKIHVNRPGRSQMHWDRKNFIRIDAGEMGGSLNAGMVKKWLDRITLPGYGPLLGDEALKDAYSGSSTRKGLSPSQKGAAYKKFLARRKQAAQALIPEEPVIPEPPPVPEKPPAPAQAPAPSVREQLLLPAGAPPLKQIPVQAESLLHAKLTPADFLIPGKPLPPVEEISPTLRAALRATNPPHARDKKSFGEQVEEAYAKQIAFAPFMKQLFTEWEKKERPLSAKQFSEWVNQRHDDMGIDEPHLGFASVYKWMTEPDALQPNSVRKLVRAFGLERDDLPSPQRHRQELMLWRVIGNSAAKVAEIQPALDEAIRTDETGPLFRQLSQDSGIPHQRLSALSDTKPWLISKLMEGGKTTAAAEMEQLLNILNPVDRNITGMPETFTRQQNARIVKLAASRKEMTIDEMIKEARESDSPSVTLMNHLVGPKGIYQKSDADVAHQITTRLAGETKPGMKLNGELTGPALYQIRRGRTPVPEKYARVFIALANVPANMVEDCVDIITGIERPEKLLEKVEAGKMTAPAMFADLRKRRGLLKNECTAAPAPITRFESGQSRGRSHINLIRSLAQDLDLDTSQTRRFALLAMDETPLRDGALLGALKDAENGTRDKQEVIDTLFSQTALAPGALLLEMGERMPSVIHNWGTFGCGPKAREVSQKLCALLNIAEEDRAAFTESFERLYGFRDKFIHSKTRNGNGTHGIPASPESWRERHNEQQTDAVIKR